MIPKPVIIDISEWQEPEKINYPQLAKTIDGVIIRIQYGSLHIDKHYKTHIKRFKELGVPVAVYAWVRGTSYEDMAQEASDFWQRAQFYKPSFWWLDVEEQSMMDMRGGCEVYRQTLKKLGAGKVGAYIANHLYQKFNLDTAKFEGIWIPSYGTNNGGFHGAVPSATKSYDLHQYTSEGRRLGYDGPLDLNRLSGTKGFDHFFGKQSASESANPGKLKAKKKFTLYADVFLRREPDTEADEITMIRAGDVLRFDDIRASENLLWGVQPRDDGSQGFFPIGKIESYGAIE